MIKRIAPILIAILLFLTGCTVNPGETEEAAVAFDKAEYIVGVGSSVYAGITLTNAENVTYVSSDLEVAAVSESGKISGITPGSATITATAVAKNDANDKVSAKCTVFVNPSRYETLDGTEAEIKWLGRTFTEAGTVYCYNTSSGFEARFYGTRFSARIASAGDKTPQLCVLVDGEDSPAAHIVDLTKNKSTQTYILAEDLPRGEHTIRVCKITEAYTTSLGFVSLETDGYFLNRPEDRALKLEVYGDSITAGHKNMRTTPEEPDDSVDKIQNGCMTYAWLAANELNADLNVMARTGIGIYSAWGRPFVMKDNWDKTYLSENDFLATETGNPEWDFSRYIPDIVIINIGTNDYWYDKDETLYQQEMKNFCEELRNVYGSDTKIVLAGGMMITENMAALERVAAEFSDGNVTVLQLPESAANHPRIEDNRAAAEVLADYLKELAA